MLLWRNTAGKEPFCFLIRLVFLQGGAISYAAAVASAYGIRACVVTAASPDADLSVFRGHNLHVVPANSTLTFEHSYTWWGEGLSNHEFLFIGSQPVRFSSSVANHVPHARAPFHRAP